MNSYIPITAFCEPIYASYLWCLYMTSLDVLYYALAIGFLSVAGAIWYLTVSIVELVQQLKPIFHNIELLTADIEAVGSAVKNAQRGIVGKLIGITRFFHRTEVK